MREPIQKYFQMGTIQWMSHPPVKYPLLESVKRFCCDPYFTALEITHIADDEERAKVKDMLAQSHMKVCYGAQPRLLGPKLNPNDLNEEGVKRQIAIGSNGGLKSAVSKPVRHNPVGECAFSSAKRRTPA